MRKSASEPVLGQLSVRVLGNPVEGKNVGVEIRGVEGQRVNLELVDQNGRAVQGHRIEQAKALERVNLDSDSMPGQFLLQVHTATERQVIKMLKL